MINNKINAKGAEKIKKEFPGGYIKIAGPENKSKIQSANPVCRDDVRYSVIEAVGDEIATVKVANKAFLGKGAKQ